MSVPKKYDYDALRLEFLQSKFLSHFEFFKQVKGIDVVKNWGFNKRTSWRTKKKGEFMEEVNKEALARARESLVKWFTFDETRLRYMKQKAIKLVQQKIDDAFTTYKRNEDWSIAVDKEWKPIVLREWAYTEAKDLKTIINILKLELWEPLSVVRNETVNLSIPEEELERFWDVGLTKEEKQIARDITGLTDEDEDEEDDE